MNQDILSIEDVVDTANMDDANTKLSLEIEPYKLAAAVLYQRNVPTRLLSPQEISVSFSFARLSRVRIGSG